MSDDVLRLTFPDFDAPLPGERIPPMHKLPCGCRGVWLAPAGDGLLVLSACDGDAEAGLFVRSIEGAVPERLDRDEAARLLHAVQRLIGDGYRYRDIRSLLRLNEP